MSKNKPILCIDFDGVIHSYKTGWRGVDVIPDNVVSGFWEWAEQAAKHFELVIYSSRSKDPAGVVAMQTWLTEQRRKWRSDNGLSNTDEPLSFTFAHEKPPAFLTIDDRAICFDGTWPDPVGLLAFKPWYKRPRS